MNTWKFSNLSAIFQVIGAIWREKKFRLTEKNCFGWNERGIVVNKLKSLRIFFISSLSNFRWLFCKPLPVDLISIWFAGASTARSWDEGVGTFHRVHWTTMRVRSLGLLRNKRSRESSGPVYGSFRSLHCRSAEFWCKLLGYSTSDDNAALVNKELLA